jgi:hypothetical protein
MGHITTNLSRLAILASLSTGCGVFSQRAMVSPDEFTKGRATTALSQAEHTMLQAVFGSTLKREPIQIVWRAAVSKGSTRTIKNVIYVPKKHDFRDPKHRVSAHFRSLVAHEATHVWQYQNVGMLYMADSLFHQAEGYVMHGDRRRAYRYRLDLARPFKRYNSEQQAEIIEDYVALKWWGSPPDNCENCASHGKENTLKLFEMLIKRDINKDFMGLPPRPTEP